MPERRPIFVSAGEPSGDLHGANFTRAFLEAEPTGRVDGFGGPLMADAGQAQQFRLTELAIMGVSQIPAKLPQFFGLARRSEVYFRRRQPRAVVLIDYPGFHLALAKRATRCRVPVYYLVPPQYWAWGGWRAKKLTRFVRTTFTTLPFEEEWFRSQGVSTHYIGHPYFDELHRQRLDERFLAEARQSSAPIVGLLPGSRNSEVRHNSEIQLEAARLIRQTRPEVRFLVAAFSEPQAQEIRQKLAGSGLPVQVHVGRTPEIIEVATACLTVSGSVSLELLYRVKPSTIVYRIPHYAKFLRPYLLKVPYITLVNLLAKEELFPEVVSPEPEPARLAEPVIRWLNDPEQRQRLVARLSRIKAEVAKPGACRRAVDFLLEDLAKLGSSRSVWRPEVL